MVSGEQKIFEARMYRDALDQYKLNAHAIANAMRSIVPAIQGFYAAVNETTRKFNEFVKMFSSER